ncbi:YlbF family regulator [Kyrpidia tusciae]|uniref:YlbF family regulator n=1 Tax=Kyrpidia tusciae TaxID=33943 RepID=UPI00145C6157|nr:YlbF family regulator [Kyrpidia tusciae]
MNNLYDYAHGLARALRESEWHRKLEEARDRLQADPEARRDRGLPSSWMIFSGFLQRP